VKLSANFSVDELLRNSGSTRVPDSVLINAQHTAELLEVIRRKLGGRPIIVGSWYRTQAKNASIGGATGSAHLSGYGVDFNVQGMTPRQVVESVKLFASEIAFDQIIDERDHVHLSADPRSRRQVLIEPVEGKYETLTTPLPPVIVRAPAPSGSMPTIPGQTGNAKVVAILTAVGTIIAAIAKLLSEK
jgi:hypothetical protein